jgi:hypothetical protein
MKTLKWTVLVVMAMVFIVGFGFMAWSGPPKPQTQKEEPATPNLPQLINCPSGWHKKTGTGPGVFSCVPDKPTMSCPDGWEFYFNGCEAGCLKKADLPR